MGEHMFGRRRAEHYALHLLHLPCRALGVVLDHLALTPAPAILVVTYTAAFGRRTRHGRELSYPQPAESAVAAPGIHPGVALTRLISTETGMYGLTVRFDLTPGSGRQFDDLIDRTLEGIRAHEPGTVFYICHKVEDEPDSRVFYELYRDRDAFEEHERQEHVKHFLSERQKYLARPPRVDRLSTLSGKGVQLE